MFRLISSLISVIFFFSSVVTVDLSLFSSKGRQNVFLAPAGELPTSPPPRQIIPGLIAHMEFEVEEIKDSKGRPTVQVTMRYQGIEVKGMVPAGTSTGDDEANKLSTDKAIANLTDIIIPAIQGKGEAFSKPLDLSNHKDLIAVEEWLIKNAGKNFRTWGANATVPLSWALWEMAAKLNGLELDEYFAGFVPEIAGAPGKVHFYMNMFNGGVHAREEVEELGGDWIDVQEIMIAPSNNFSYAKQLEMGDEIDQELKKILHLEAEAGKFSAEDISRGNAFGFKVKGVGDTDLAIGYVFEAIKNAGYIPGKDVKLALDVAASEFYQRDSGKYKFDGVMLTRDEMVQYYVALVDNYKGMFLSIEDGMDQNDWEGSKLLKQEMSQRGIETIGDDIFVTQQERLQKGIDEGSASSIMIKVNQNGSVWGTLQVIRQAIGANMKFVISHRSGETLHTGIADLAEATGAFGLKTGDPEPPTDTEYFSDPAELVRRPKYKRMVAIQDRKAKQKAQREKKLKQVLAQLGIDAEEANLYHNAPIRELFEVAEAKDEGRLTATGAFLVHPTRKSDRGRRKKHRYIVKYPGSESDKNIGWSEVKLWPDEEDDEEQKKEPATDETAAEDQKKEKEKKKLETPNNPIEVEHYERIKRKVLAHLSEKDDLFVFDGFSGRHPGSQRRVRWIGEKAFQAPGVRHLLVRAEAENQVDELMGDVDFTVIAVPDFKIEREDRMPHQKDAPEDDAMIILDIEKGLVIIAGTNYIGENKKSIFSLMNYLIGLIPGSVSTHSSAGKSESTGNVVDLKGLSGTGKSTLGAQKGIVSFSDDETVIWIEEEAYKEIQAAMAEGRDVSAEVVAGVLNGELAGVYDLEGGLFPKTWELQAKTEPRLFKASRSYPSVLQNVATLRDEDDNEVLVDGRPTPDFMAHKLHGEDWVNANGRATFPRESLPDTPQDGLGGPPDVMIQLTQDRLGVLPPISFIKTPPDAEFFNLLGYTATAPGTEQGAKPGATYSPLYGDPFFPGPFKLYAKKETRIIGALNYVRRQAGKKPIPFVLLNTGWSGGPEGVGSRMPIHLTVRLRDAVLNGELDLSDGNLVEHPIFKGLWVPKVVPGVTEPDEVASLDPINSWPEERRKDYKPQADELFSNWGKEAGQRGFWDLYPGNEGLGSFAELEAAQRDRTAVSI